MKRARVPVVAVAAVLAACGGSTPPPVPQPPPPVAAPPTTTALTPARVAGVYRIRADIQGQGAQGRGRARSQARAGTLHLDNAPVAAPDPDIQSAAQFSASVALAGYTRPPRGRTTQAAAWYPIAGDSLVVQFRTAAAAGAQLQLRGVVTAGGQTVRGDVWFLNSAGDTFQLGTFVATRQR